MANKRRYPELESRWRKLVSRHASSGLTARAFCERERVSEPSFYSWRRILGERARPDETATPAFVPMAVSQVGRNPRSTVGFVLELRGGHRLRLPETMARAAQESQPAKSLIASSTRQY